MITVSPIKDDCHGVMDAAAALGIREYDFFDLAFRRWSGHRAESKFLERAFADYMFHKTLPPWVRHLSREVIGQAQKGVLDPASMGLEAYRRHEKLPRLSWLNCTMSGVATLAVYALIMAIFLFPGQSVNMAVNTASNMAAGVECNGAPGSRFFQSWVYTIAGKDTPPCGLQKPLR